MSYLLTFCHKIFARCIENFEILHGELHGLSDTVTFLNSLSGLDHGIDSGKTTEKRRERIAASALFNWEVVIYTLPSYVCCYLFSLCVDCLIVPIPIVVPFQLYG